MGRKSGIGSKKQIVELDPLAMMDNLFSADVLSIFDTTTLDAPELEEQKQEEQPEALLFKEYKPTKREFLSVKANEYLHQILVSLPPINHTWHCISNSRFNFFSFIPSVIKYLGDYTTILYCATWTTNNINSKQLIDLFDSGKIGHLTFVVGNYFKVREAPIYNFLASKLLERKQTIIAGEHHAKILLLQNQEHYITIESSANLCANPRTEQFTYSNDQALFNFYRNWFDGLTQKEEKTPNE